MTRQASLPVVVYLTYDGLLEPLGESQVVQYLLHLASNYEIHVISFEKRDDWDEAGRRVSMATRLASANIVWYPRPYHKSPTLPATAFDAIRASFLATRIAITRRACVLHARSYLMGVAAMVASVLSRTPFIFDMRGFWPDEKVEGGMWSDQSGVYKAAKWFEKRLLERCDGFVTLTRRSIDVMRERNILPAKPFAVIPTCVDLQRFSPRNEKGLGMSVGYFGSTGAWYSFEPTAQVFAILARKSDANFVIVTRDDHEQVRQMLVEASVPMERVKLLRANYNMMPELIRAVSGTVFFIRPSYSKQASAPTRLAEVLASGVPVMSNSGVGDYESLLEFDRAGVITRELTGEALERSVDEFLEVMKDPATPARCRAVAIRDFDVARGAEAYAKLYAKVDRKLRSG